MSYQPNNKAISGIIKINHFLHFINNLNLYYCLVKYQMCKIMIFWYLFGWHSFLYKTPNTPYLGLILLTNQLLQQFIHLCWIGFTTTGFHHLSDQSIKGFFFSAFVFIYHCLIVCQHFFDNRFNRPCVGGLF